MAFPTWLSINLRQLPPSTFAKNNLISKFRLSLRTNHQNVYTIARLDQSLGLMQNVIAMLIAWVAWPPRSEKQNSFHDAAPSTIRMIFAGTPPAIESTGHTNLMFVFGNVLWPIFAHPMGRMVTGPKTTHPVPIFIPAILKMKGRKRSDISSLGKHLSSNKKMDSCN